MASAGIQQKIVHEMQARLNSGQLELLTGMDPVKIEAVVQETTEAYLQHTIAVSVQGPSITEHLMTTTDP